MQNDEEVDVIEQHYEEIKEDGGMDSLRESVHLVAIADGVGPTDYLHGAVVAQLGVASLDEVVEDVARGLVAVGGLLGLRELLLQRLDLLLPLGLDGLGEILDFHLLLEVGLGSTPLAACLEEVVAGTLRRCTRRKEAGYAMEWHK